MGNTGRRVAAVALTAVLVVSSACSGDDDDSTTVITDPVETTESTTTSTSSTTSTTIDPDAEVKAEVEAAYLAYWDAVLEIFAEPNPGNPLIERHTTGAVRRVTLEAVAEDALEGRVVQPPEDPDDYTQTVLEVEVHGSSATVRACAIDGALVIDRATNEVLDDDLVTLLLTATLANEGTWKVETSQVEDRREGRWDCRS